MHVAYLTAVYIHQDEPWYLNKLCVRANNAQDVKLKTICEINNLLSKQKGQHTFLHVNGKDSAEIDYILFNMKAQSLIRTVKTETYTDINTSDHIPVTSTLKFKVIKIDKNIAEIKVKPKWEKCDTQLYSYYIANQLHPFNSPQSDYEFVLSLGQFVSTLKNAVKISIPGHRDSRKVNPVKVRVWNEEICTAVKMCKSAWWQWRMAGEPENADHPLTQHVKKCKRNLRKAQRQAEARRRIEQAERIMASTGTDKEFYRLIKHQRKTQNSTLAFTRAVNFQIDLRGGQWKTIWFTSGGQFERFLSSVFVGCSKVTGKIILDPTHILKFGEWHAISFLCMHVHTKRYWKVLSRVVAINFVQNAQWRNRKVESSKHRWICSDYAITSFQWTSIVVVRYGDTITAPKTFFYKNIHFPYRARSVLHRRAIWKWGGQFD